MCVDEFALLHTRSRFDHNDIQRIRRAARRGTFARTIVIDLSRVLDATTDAFADLVLLRRELLRDGRDLRLTGLRGRAAEVYNFNRLRQILPLR